MSARSWDEQIAVLPGAHILQTTAWAELKGRYGWEPIQREWRGLDGQLKAAALVLQRTVRLGGFGPRLRVLYVPRGPLLDWDDTELRAHVLNDLQALARKQGAIFIKMDPEVVLGTGIPGEPGAVNNPGGQAVQEELARRGWLFSSDQIQFRNTVWLDLRGSEEEMLARMKQKTRYNLRLAQRKGVSVRIGSETDLALLYKMYAETSVRDGFVIRSEDYYRNLWGLFMQRGMAAPLVAEVEGEPVGALILFLFVGKAWYLFGMSRDAHRDKMPNYILQWEAMRMAKTAGCTRYDLWGAPDVFSEEDSMWGVFRFKEGLGGQVARTLGAWDYASSPWLYTLYTRTLPKILDVMRRRGREETKQAL
jgi:peptidoglycan pentaglycine glycine transferase (the first glycine)